VLVLNRREVEKLLDLDALIDALAPAMADLSAGRASVPERIGALVSERQSLLGAMPGYVPSIQALVAKLVTLFPGNAGGELPTHQAVICCFDPESGKPLALLDGTHITAARTAACSALSARILSREDAETLAIIGTGVQARSHARAMCRVRAIRRIRVAGRNRERARALADELAGELDVDAVAAASPGEALAGATLACATTHSPDPVVRLEWIEPGAHVTSVGYNPAGREIDDEAVRAARLFVETRRSALAPMPAGTRDLIDPLNAGIIAEEEIAELGEVITGTREGRGAGHEITLYKSVGVAAQDAAAAALVLNEARGRGAGREVEL
jgi:alanine dehydrogenase